MKLVVAQLGARRHYAIPRILERAGMLARFCTDVCAVTGWPRWLRALPASWRPAGLKRLLGRVPEGVPAAKVRTFSGFGLQYALRLARARGAGDATRVYLWAGERFGELVLRHGLGGADGVYTFNSAGLELLRHARARGLRAVMEQTIAPREVEQELLDEEHERHPGWEPRPPGDAALAEYAARERAEWDEADLILCGSEFVREGVAACGGPVERCAVVPYGVDGRFAVPERPPHGGPLRVLTVGAVGLRKGTPYVLEAARRLGARAEFRLAGPVAVSEAARRELANHVRVLGPVPRSEIVDQFAWADVFLLPSVCEGSATAIYEALASGLPVICTPNAGSVVRDGVDGFVVPVRDAGAVVECLETLAGRPDLRRAAARRARARAAEFTLRQYGRRLVRFLESRNGSDILAGR